MALIEAPTRVGHVIHALEVALAEVGTREGDELVYQVVVEVR